MNLGAGSANPKCSSRGSSVDNASCSIHSRYSSARGAHSNEQVRIISYQCNARKYSLLIPNVITFASKTTILHIFWPIHNCIYVMS